ncbi:MAG: uroporphyrinogen decarboxylase family protein [Anaerolineae bacterium]|jgi:uroporphyrinogen decarboxylase
MTPREMVIAQLNHEETPYIPYAIGFEGDVAERLDAYYGSTRWRELLDNHLRAVVGANLGTPGPEEGCLVRDLHGTLWRTDRRPVHLEEPALKKPSLEGYTFPSMDEVFPEGQLEASRQAAEKLRERYFVYAGIGFGLFERTWTLRSFNEALMDAAAEPDFYDELVERICQHQLELLDRVLELPIDGIRFSDDWGYQRGVLLGTERWRRFIKPRLARLYQRVHDAGKYALSHCCGNVADIVPDLIEIKLDCLESIQPEAMDPYELKRLYGDKIAFWGGLGSQSTIPFGTPAAIKAEVERLCREMGRGGGYILGPAKSLQPETSTENAAAVVEAFLAQAGVELSAG